MGYIKEFNDEYTDYLYDESRKTGEAQSISFPINENEVKDILSALYNEGIPITIQGARTGITAGAVPIGGHILNLSRMDRVTGLRFDSSNGCFYVTVQPGLILSQLREIIEKKEFDTGGWSDTSLEALQLFKNAGKFFFPPDPTETSASIGGMVACNASGACSYYYGSTRDYINAINIFLADGSYLHLERRKQKAAGNTFSLKTSSRRVVSGCLPDYKMPDVKNASGYFAKEGMDLIDLFIGSEGTLGIITGIELSLVKAPSAIYGLMCFFPSEQLALELVNTIRSDNQKPVAIEFFNSNALELLRNNRDINPVLAKLPDMPPEFHSAVYIEYHGDDDEELFGNVIDVGNILEGYGIGESAIWIASNENELERLKLFRHSTPETVNTIIGKRRLKIPGLTKLGTDMAVCDKDLVEVMEMYNKDLQTAGLESIIFGHIGNNHLHVNILPNSIEEYDKGKGIYLKWAKEVIKMGGTISAEHGVGKLKSSLLKEMYGEAGVSTMRNLKGVFDEKMILNRGNLFE